MGAKRKQNKAAAAAAGEPAAKEAKKAEKEEEKKEEKKEAEPTEEGAAKEVPEEPKEKEEDDKKDARPPIKEPVIFLPHETTLNVVPVNGGKVLMALSDGGMQFLIAGARANVGIKSGRYFFEVKVIEALTPSEGRTNGKSRVPMPRQLVRLGFSTAGSSLVLGDGSDTCVCFDAEGFFYAEKKRTQASARFGRDQALGVLLNLDEKSPNAGTLSLFCNGQRISQPQPLPEKLKGETLFPHISYRNVSVQVSFGPAPMSALPFKCRMLQEAAAADVKEVKSEKPKDGKYEVLFPVAFPDEGTFDWLDSFLEKHPTYTELSDRKIQEWAVKSGVWKPKNNWKSSNDKPEYNFGLQFMDDFSVRRVLNSATGVMPRNYVVMEVKQNLTQADRKNNLKRFRGPHFKRIAHVVMGEPPKEYKAKVHKQLLAAKQNKAEVEWKMRKIEKDRKKAIAARQKEIAAQKAALEAKKKEEEEAKKKEEAAKKEEEDAKKKEEEGAAEGEKKEEGEEKKEEKKEEEKKEEQEKQEEKTEEKEEEKNVEEKAEEKEEEDVDEPMPQAELSEAELKLNFKPPTSNDLTSQVLNSSFAEFCIPEKDEGFDDIKYEWQNEAKSKDYLKKWILEKKVTSRIEDLVPGESFKKKLADFQSTSKEWQAKHKEFKASQKKVEAKKDDEEDEGKMDVDIFSVENILDVGNGEPLFASFAFEDWALVTLRFELHLMQACFLEDAKDEERVGIHENHLLFYYSKYYKKQLSPTLYGKENVQEVVELVKDALKIDPESKMLTSVLKEDPDTLATFVKVQEENRRKRQQRIDAGDETARLNFTLLQNQESHAQGSSWSRGGKDRGWRSKGAGKSEPRPAAAPAAPPAPAAPGPAVPVPVAPPAPAAPEPKSAPHVVPVPPPSGGPRLVPAPRSKGWQNKGKDSGKGEEQSWKDKGGKDAGKAGGGRWQQTYAPRVAGGKGGKDGKK